MADGTFPANPTHGMLFEQKNGVIYQYDASIKSWIKLATDNLLMKLVTPVSDGAMPADDLKKLNRLVIPAPTSTLLGNKCTAPFISGTIDMRSSDRFIGIGGNTSLQNIDQYGDLISKDYPYQIHQHTYGFDFTLNVRELISELESRGQIKLEGSRGPKGEKGDIGDAGANAILAGPQGKQGSTGATPSCPLSVEPEVLDAQLVDGSTRVLVDARTVTDPTDPTKYSLVFDRQVVGNTGAVATKFNVKNVKSSWVLATGVGLFDDNEPPVEDAVDCGIPGERGPISSPSNSNILYYVDIQPIMDSIHQKFLAEVDALKSGYEKSVGEWLQSMSDLFDEQKRALCCALEKCISLTKSTSLRQHMESVAATALGKAKIVLNSRDSNQAIKISHTRPLKQLGNEDLCENGPEFPQNPAAEWRESTNNGSEPLTPTIVIDPLINSSAANANKILLDRGEYIATISKAESVIGGKHRANARIRYINGGKHKTVTFMDKGSYHTSSESQQAYNGLTVSFKHDGGPVEFYLPSLSLSMTYGSIQIGITKKTTAAEPVKAKPVTDIDCGLTAADLKRYEKAWQNGTACGCVVNISGQDYIICKVSSIDSCGESDLIGAECIKRHTVDGVAPAIAWPTFDGNSFIATPRGKAELKYDEELSNIVVNMFNAGDVSQKRGSISKVLFPAK